MRPLFRGLAENRYVIVMFVIAILTFFFVCLHLSRRSGENHQETIAPTINAPGAPKKSKRKKKTMEIKKRFRQPNLGRIVVVDNILVTTRSSRKYWVRCKHNKHLMMEKARFEPTLPGMTEEEEVSAKRKASSDADDSSPSKRSRMDVDMNTEEDAGEKKKKKKKASFGAGDSRPLKRPRMSESTPASLSTEPVDVDMDMDHVDMNTEEDAANIFDAMGVVDVVVGVVDVLVEEDVEEDVGDGAGPSIEESGPGPVESMRPASTRPRSGGLRRSARLAHSGLGSNFTPSGRRFSMRLRSLQKET